MAYSSYDKAILSQFGARVREARLSREWSQEELADQVGVHRTYIGGVERGERNVALLIINQLSVALEDSFDDVFPINAPGRYKPKKKR
ncbi:MAG: helix-turn-helix domain-containing protein [Pseudomonadales bacterium]|nr:helix-turn-helix domain-containing protein [Pseudomonadales bacterium]